MSVGYQQLWKAVIRPPRAEYQNSELGPKYSNYQGLEYKRTDVEIVNERGLKLVCSHYEPQIRVCRELPCVIYLHGNSSCRIEGIRCIPYVLCHGLSLFTFDFAGCGNSEGEYISLGYYQRQDVDCVFKYLRGLGTVSSIGLWGRSMGAVTALMYADRNHEIACIVCDSAFSNMEKLCKELADKYGGGVVSFFSGFALMLLAKTIKEKNNFDIADLNPLGKHVKKAYIPAFFLAAKDDNFILPEHTKKLYEAYSGQKVLKITEGDHNSQRSQDINQEISKFLYNSLHVSTYVVQDLEYMKQQKAALKEEKKKEKEKSKSNQGLNSKKISKSKQMMDNIFSDSRERNQQEQEEEMLKLAIQQSLKESKKESKSNDLQKKVEKNGKQKEQKEQKKQKNEEQKGQKISLSNNKSKYNFSDSQEDDLGIDH